LKIFLVEMEIRKYGYRGYRGNMDIGEIWVYGHRGNRYMDIGVIRGYQQGQHFIECSK